MVTTLDKEGQRCIVMVSGVWSVTREALIVMQLLQYVLNWDIMTMLPTALYLSKYRFIVVILLLLLLLL